MNDKIGAAFHVSSVGVSSRFGGDTFTLKAHFHTRGQAELAKKLLETETLLAVPRDTELVALAKLHAVQHLTNGTDSRWWFNFAGLRALIEAARASAVAGVKEDDKC